MSEEKKSRTVAEISQEYSGACTRAGHLQYQIDALSQDLKVLNSAMRDLNFEAAAAQAKAAEEAKPAEEPKEAPKKPGKKEAKNV